MNIVICDDNTNDVNILKELIAQYDSKKGINAKVFSYGSSDDFLKDIDTVDADIIFLDINMDGIDGLSLAKKIRLKNEDVPIVLVTAFINYALDGYKVRATRFLVKDDLDKTFCECMDDICDQIQKRKKEMLFSCVEGEVRIKLSEIIFVETTGHKSIIHLETNDYHLYESMDEMEKRLKMFGFIRVHQSFLVNASHIRSINNYILTLDTGYEIKIPKARYKKVREERSLFLGKSL